MAATEPRSRAEQESQRLWRLAAMGGTLASEILAGALLGWCLDALLKTGTTFLIIGTIVGVVVGMTTFIRRAMAETRQAGRSAHDIAARMAAEREAAATAQAEAEARARTSAAREDGETAEDEPAREKQ